MTIRRSRSSRRTRNMKLRQRRAALRKDPRRLEIETLEERRLLAVGPQLIGVQPNDGALLPFDATDIRNVAPRDLTFRFDENQVFDPNDLDGIQVTRSNLDGSFAPATVASDFNTNNAVQLRFTAQKLGDAQNGIQIAVSKRDQGNAGAPTIGVVGNVINVSLNTNLGNESTALDLINAINANIDASALVRAEISAGDPTTDIASPAINYSPLTLQGANDVVITPGFIGLGDFPNEIIVRFSETLPDDVYQIDIFGQGKIALRNITGDAFNDTTDDGTDNGSNVSLNFELDLGAQITAVIPQPTFRLPNGQLDQARDKILVYFNDDDLDPATAENPIFYQLIFTNDTIHNTDDVVFKPTSVEYNPDTDSALLTFSNNLDALVDPGTGTAVGPGSFRLRIGTDEDAPLPPTTLDLRTTPDDPSSTFANARNLNGVWDTGHVLLVRDGETEFGEGQRFTIVDDSGDERIFEFTRDATVSGSNTPVMIVGGETATDMATAIATAINDLSAADADFSVAATAVAERILLDGDRNVVLGPSLTALGLSSQGIIINQEIMPTDILAEIYDLDFPGGEDEIGHRELDSPGEDHLLGDDEADSDQGITTFQYNFRGDLGFIPGEPGDPFQPAFNTITEAQKQRAREIFEMFSTYAGVQFVETEEDGFIIATGDLRAIDPTIESQPGGVAGLAGATANGPAAIMDNAETWTDEFGGSWFQVAMHEIGHLVGMGHTSDLPPITVMNDDRTGDPNGNGLVFDNDIEPDFPGDDDIVHLQYLYRPESKDIDVFAFSLPETGVFSAETISERRRDFSSQEDGLDTHLALYQERVRFDEVTGLPLRDASGSLVPVLDANGDVVKDLIARNDDYYSEDSFVELALREGNYFLIVTASGNESFDPQVNDSGIGGVSQGAYDLRLNFRPDADRAITDADNPLDPTKPEIVATELDGDADGVPGGVYDFWFRTAAPSGLEGVDEPRVVFVDKSYDPATRGPSDGTLARPFNNLMVALNVDQAGVPLPTPNPNAVRPGDILRVVGNGGMDGDIRTEDDNLGYEIGFNELGEVLQDGSTFEIPRNVTMMVDAGTIFKLRRARIGAGSSSPGPQKDRSAGAIQVLGTTVFIDAMGNVISNDGTAFRDLEPLLNLAGDANEKASVHFTSYNDENIGLDTFTFLTNPAAGDWGGIIMRADVDNADQTRFSYEEQGIFLNYVNHADMRYGGGSVVIESDNQVVTPIQIQDSRPTVSFNEITLSRDAAMSATPNSFLETNFHSPEFQENVFTADYDRVGPDVHGNRVFNNTQNALFIRINTPAGSQIRELTVPGRLDDTDIVHVMKENLVIKGTPGGPFLELEEPSLEIVTVNPEFVAGGTLAPGTYNYRLVFVDGNGNESRASTPTEDVVISGGANAARLSQLLAAEGDFVARRLYRSSPTGTGPYTLIAQINQNDTTYLDDGTTSGGLLDEAAFRLRPRFDARLAIDPAVIVKLDGARFQQGVGAQFIAEGRDGLEVVLTSLADDRYGAGGTFDTSNDGFSGAAVPQPGDWGGVFVSHLGSASIDHAIVAYGGGVTRIEGTFSGFNVVEIHQSKARIANTVFEFNASGIGGQGPVSRFGRGFNEEAVIFVRGAQPVIIDNIIRNNRDTNPATNIAAISINVNALNHYLVTDWGRSTGFADRLPGFRDNQGPLIVDNRIGNNDINGMMVRGETLTTQSVWDDTSITHVLFDTVYVPDFHTFRGLRLESSPNESLVVKLRDDADSPAGFTATGRPLEIDDRIGGIVQIVGQPKSPVVLTSVADDTNGAGIQPNGDPQTDTNNDGDFRGTALAARPQPGDWTGILLDRYSHDRNVDTITEQEPRDVNAPGPNATAINAQPLGALAPDEKSGDDNLRLGFEVHGFLSNPQDRDVYSFQAESGTEVWVDIDRTTHASDLIIELIDGNDTVLARSVNSRLESRGEIALFENPSDPGLVFVMQKTPPFLGDDVYSTNPRDPGFRLVLTGPVDTLNTYHLRVRSNTAPGDIDNVNGGISSGGYQMQIRLQELDEVGGSTIQYADIAYADTGISVLGQPIHSPLLGEQEEIDAGDLPNDVIAGAQLIGNLLTSDRAAISVAGDLLPSETDIDWFQFEVTPDDVQEGAPRFAATFDVDYADGLARPNTAFYIFDVNGNLVLVSRDSNIAEDRPGPLEQGDVDDLNRGSVGAADPYVGTQELPVGTYFIAVASTRRRIDELDQFSNAGAANPLLRLEPVNSTIRIAEDHIDIRGTVATAVQAEVTTLLDQDSIVPFHLGDVGLYVITDEGGSANILRTVDPFTGQLEYNNFNFNTQFDVHDIDFRRSGELFGFTNGLDHPVACTPQDDGGVTGHYVEFNTGTGTIQDLGHNGIFTFEFDAAGAARRAHPCPNPNTLIGWGVHMNALVFGAFENFNVNGNTTERLLAVGNRGDLQFTGFDNGIELKRNVLYAFDPDTGAVLFDTNATRTAGAGTDAVEVGQLLTSPQMITDDVTTLDPFGRTVFNIDDGDTFEIDDGFSRTRFEFDLGPQVQQNIDLNRGQTIRDGDFFLLDPDEDTTGDESIFQFDTGPVINFFSNGAGLQDGTIVTVQNNAVPSVSASFEYDSDNPQALTDPTATRLVFGGGTSAIQLAATLAQAVNGVAALGVVASPVGSRVTFTGDFTVSVSVGPPATQVTGVRVEGDHGVAPILQVLDPSLMTDGDHFIVRTGVTPADEHRFEFDDNNVFTGTRVPFNTGQTPEQLAAAIETAINTTTINSGLTVKRGGPRLAINGQNIFSTIEIQTLNASVLEQNAIQNSMQVEESFSALQIGAAVETSVNPDPDFTASSSSNGNGDRISFQGAETADFRGVGAPIWVDQNTRGGVAPGNLSVPLLARDEASSYINGTPPTLQPGVAIKIAAAINAAFQGTNVTAMASGRRVDLTAATPIVSAPFVAQGEGPGGNVTGMAVIDGDIYAVSDLGGLYRFTVDLVTPNAPRILTQEYIGTSANDLLGLNLQAISQGPPNVEGGRYADLLFGVTGEGRLYAFDTDGVLQPIFVDGAKSVQLNLDSDSINTPDIDIGIDTGLVRGIAFSPLDRNLFHQTANAPFTRVANEFDVRVLAEQGVTINVGDTITVDERQGTPGHGINPAFDFSRGGAPGRSSFSFGRGNVGGTPLTYDFAGGAHGTVISNEFSLREYAPEDRPVLYFNYFSQTQNSAQDSVRVFVADNSGDWQLVSSNGGAIFDNTATWRQVRIPLENFAGLDHLRLRFDFSSNGDMNVGDQLARERFTTGSELRAIDGMYLRDGDFFTIDGQDFEFESGFTFVPPSGPTIPEGATFEVEDHLGNREVFEFDRDGTQDVPGSNLININDQLSGSDIARLMEIAINLALPAITTHLNDERLNLEVAFGGDNQPPVGAIDATHDAIPAFATFLEGMVGPNFGGDPVLLYVHEDLDRVEVADEMNRVLEPAFYRPVIVANASLDILDGETFTIDNGTALTQTFEFDSGFIVPISGAGAISFLDEDSLVLSDGVNTLTYEFDFDSPPALGGGGDIAIPLTVTDAQFDIVQRIVTTINNTIDPRAALLGLSARVLSSGRVQILANDDVTLTRNSTLGFDSEWIVEVSSVAGVLDGDLLTITDNNLADGFDDTLVVEFVRNFPAPFGDIFVLVNGGETQAELTQEIVDAINNSNDPRVQRLGLSARNINGSRAFLRAQGPTTVSDTSATGLITSLDMSAPGVMAGNEPVFYAPSLDFPAGTLIARPADSVARSIEDAIDNVAGTLFVDATIETNAQRRIELNSQIGANTNLIVTPDRFNGITLELPISDVTNDIVKQHRDLIRVIGHTVNNPGPLGFDERLAGDPRVEGPPTTFDPRHHFPDFGGPNVTNPSDFGFNNVGGQNNLHEGFYIDDLIIGLAERGEMATGAAGITSSTILPDNTNVNVGPYQLEVRRSEPYLLDGLTFNTNDRQSQGYTMVAQDGAHLVDGETFVITDGVNEVVFEYEDTLRNNGVTSGNIRVRFNSEMPAWQVARNIRDAVNRGPVRAILPVRAALSDGPENVLIPDLDDFDTLPDLRNGPVTTSIRVNLFGPVRVVRDSNLARVPIEEVGPGNDVIANATGTTIAGFNSPSFLGGGTIGDNPNFPLKPGRDVDLFEISLAQGELLRIDVDANEVGSDADPVLRVFDSFGNELVRVDDVAAPGEIASLDPYLEFTAPFGGTNTYYVGVSGFPRGAPKFLFPFLDLYDATMAGFTEGGALTADSNTGFYQLDMTFGISTGTDVLLFDRIGDQNRHRDQGQILIRSNTISHTATTGVLVDAGRRDADEGLAPHQGAPRHLDEVNLSRLAPGVTVSNNLIFDAGQVGIHFSGDLTAANEPISAIPFGRIVNNTVFGAGGNLMGQPTGVNDTGILVDDFSSPTLLNNIVANFSQGVMVAANSGTTVVGGMLYQGNLLPTNVNGDFEVFLTNTDRLFVNPAIENFYLAPGTNDAPNRAIDSSVSSLEERFGFNLIRDPLGIAPSPILAPERDVTGQLRVDDPDTEPPSGLGENVFIDRGALDRSDFSGPVAVLINPRDNDADDLDQNRADTVVEIPGDNVLSRFEIRLVDGVEPADPNEGIGVDDTTVVSPSVRVTMNGVELEDGVDYSFSYNPTSDIIRLTPLSGIWTPDRIYTVTVNNTDHFFITLPDGNQLADGDSFRITDLEGNATRFEFESGYRLQVLQTLAIQVPIEGGGLGGITDSETFTVSDGTQLIRFEFDRTSLNNGTDPNHVPIQFGVNDTADDLAAKIRDALILVDVGLSPVVLGDGIVHIGALNNHVIDTSLSRLVTLGAPNVAIEDGDLFTIDDGNRLVTFEFDNNDIDDGVGMNNGTMNVEIGFVPADTHEQIAQAIIQAIINENLGLTPEDLGDGHIYLGGEIRHILDTNLVDTTLQQSGRPGVSPAFGLQIPTQAGRPFGIQDGETFTIRDGVNPRVQFEMDNTDVNSGVTLGNVRIAFNNTSTVEEIAETIRIAILGAGLGLNPVYQGNGIIDLQDSTTDHVVVVDDTSISLRGAAGVAAAVPVLVSPVERFDATQVAVAVIDAINRPATMSPTQLVNVLAEPAGGANVIIKGADPNNGVVDINNRFVRNDFVGAIKDLAVNDLKANQLSGETQFTIVLGDVAMDLGDAADPELPTLSGSNGAIHVLASPLRLGERVDAERDGQPTVGGDGDDVDGDGVAITSGSAALTVTPAATPATITVDAGGGSAFSDGDTLTVNGVEFEFNDTLLSESVTFGRIRVDYEGTDDQAAVADSIVATLISAGLKLNLNPIHEGSGVITLNGNDDDGVVFNGILNAFVTTPIEVTASDIGLLDAWIDYNRDGDWDDLGEQIFASQQLAAGVNMFNINTPRTAVPGPTYARFRISSSGGLKATGLTADGEVEDYQVDIVPGSPPEADDDAYTIDEDTILSRTAATGLFANDQDPDGDPFMVTAFDDPSVQLADVDVDTTLNTLNGGAFTYDPTVSALLQALPVGGSIVDTFTYTVDDGISGADSATVRVTVTGVNDVPTVSNQTLSLTDGDGTLADVDFAGDDADSDDSQSTLTYAIINDLPSGDGTVTNNGSTFTFDPGSDFEGLGDGMTRTVSFTYRATDQHGAVSVPDATVSITVTGINNPPDANDVPIDADEDGGAAQHAFDADDVDDDDTPASLTYMIVSDLATTGEGSVTNDGGGLFTYDPEGDFQELALDETTTVDFTYKVTDSHGVDSSEATVTVTVTGVNDDPVATPQSETTTEDSSITRPFDADDIDSDDTRSTLDYAIIDDLGANEGSVSINASNGAFTFNPGTDFQDLGVGASRVVTFTYQATDQHNGTSAVTTVTITVEGRNDAPVASPVNLTAVEDGPVVDGSFDADDVDSDDNPSTLTYTFTSFPSEGLAGNNDDGTFTFDPADDFQDLPVGEVRTVEFTYKATDQYNVDSADATISVDVTGVNDAPTAVDDPVSNFKNQPITIPVLDNDFDVDSSTQPGAQGTNIVPGTVTITSDPANGDVVIESDGSITYTPDPEFVGSDSFQYTVEDDLGVVSAPATVTVNTVIPWQNPANPLDVNADGIVSPQDVLIIFNYLNANGSGPLPLPTPGFQPPPFLDPTGDNLIAPNDALLIIDSINSNAGGEGEAPATADAGEGEADRPLDLIGVLDSGLFTAVDGDGTMRNDRLAEVAPQRQQMSADDNWMPVPAALSRVDVRELLLARGELDQGEIEDVVDEIAKGLEGEDWDRDEVFENLDFLF